MRKILISIFAISFSIILQATNVDSVFLKLPSKILPLINAKARFEMLEYFKAGQTDSVKNSLGGFARILYRDTTQQHIILKPALNSILDIRLFKTSDSTYITGIISTVGEEIFRSVLEFYNADGSRMNLQLPEISSEEWYRNWASNTALQTDDFKANLLNDNFLRMNFSKTGNLIEVQNYTVKLLHREHQNMISELTGNKQTEENKILFRINCYLCSPFIEKLKSNDRK
jgi:hypothetical protein